MLMATIGYTDCGNDKDNQKINRSTSNYEIIILLVF